MPNKVDPDSQEREQTALLRAFTGTTQHYWGDWGSVFAGVRDPRNPVQIIYSLSSLLFTGTFMYICQLGARRGTNDQLRGNSPSQTKFEA